MITGSMFIIGWKHDAAAPIENYWFNIGIYAAFIAVHIIMTMPSFKKAVYGPRAGTPVERQIYMVVSIVTWLAVFWFHRAVPGFEYASPDWLAFIGTCAVLLTVFGFFEFADFEKLDALVGMPGSAVSHTAGDETPLFTEGTYEKIRHPMYRAGLLMGLVSLMIHPHAGQLLFAVMVAASFILPIPFEESQLLKARGEGYREYMRQTPWRLFKGIW
jgi:protein-S-isoprenylcysteine O-methyltransferase Ste14